MFHSELKQAVTRINGVGPKLATALSSLKINTIEDILRHYPRTYEDRTLVKDLSQSFPLDENITVNAEFDIISHQYFGRPDRPILKVIVKDQNDIKASLLCFNRNFLKNKLIPGFRVLIFGSFQDKFNEIQSSAFEFELLDDNRDIKIYEDKENNVFLPRKSGFGKILPIYPLVSGISQKKMRSIIKDTLMLWALNLENELPANVIREFNLLSKKDALFNIHLPVSFEKQKQAEKTLKFEELFHFQLTALRRAYKRKAVKKQKIVNSKKNTLKDRFISEIDFKLTDAQLRVLKEITEDQLSESLMSRLLQGDVGCGKTLVSFAAALNAVEARGQVAFMAPTTILARQHADKAEELLSKLGIRLALLTAGIKTREKQLLLSKLKEGEIDIIIGTHSLFNIEVEFKRLSLIIIDEQQRFGVMQRMLLAEKNTNADILMMSATPIPRTLALTVFGDLDVSTIDEMPPGRTAVETHLAAIGREKKVYDFVKNELNKGHQAYFVYPLINHSDKISLKDAETMFKKLKEHYLRGYSIGLIHSKLDASEKSTIMDEFKRGKLQVIAATSLIEVGVDVPNATCMIVEHAERFGLSVLHQLRGRVGRGQYKSYAFLVYSENLTETGIARLKIMKESTDGFFIAEEDLKIRGPGNLGGEEQSGFIPFTIANLNTDFDILRESRTAALKIMNEDPGLINAENSRLRYMLEACPPFNSTIAVM